MYKSDLAYLSRQEIDISLVNAGVGEELSTWFGMHNVYKHNRDNFISFLPIIHSESKNLTESLGEFELWYCLVIEMHKMLN